MTESRHGLPSNVMWRQDYDLSCMSQGRQTDPPTMTTLDRVVSVNEMTCSNECAPTRRAHLLFKGDLFLTSRRYPHIDRGIL